MPEPEPNSAQGSDISHCAILNDNYSDELSNFPIQFPQFSRLAIEIRLTIWKLFLQRSRLIGISLSDNKLSSLEPSDGRLPKPPSGKTYQTTVDTNHQVNVLFRVCHEAREIALNFYRVRIPCGASQKDQSRYLYFNPENDILHIKSETNTDLFPRFIHDIKVYDPLGKGVMNIAVGWGECRSDQLPMDPTKFSPQVLSSFTTIVQNLDQVFFYSTQRGESRFMFEYLWLREVHFNRSYPIHSAAEAFEIITHDPRPIDADLKRVAFGIDPSWIRCLWRDMEKAFNIQRLGSQITKFKFIIDADTWKHGRQIRVCNRVDAVSFLEDEERFWKSSFEKGGYYQVWGDNKYPDTMENLEKAPLPVVGFWILPVDVFGDLPEESFEQQRWEMKKIVDLSLFRPEVGVFQLT